MPTAVVACTEEEVSRVRSVVADAYGEMRARHWPFLSDVLERVLRGVPEEDRGIIAAAVQALVKYDRLLAFACGTDDARARLGALFQLARGEAAEVDARLAAVANPTERRGIAYSMPDWLVEAVGDDALLARMNEIPPRVLRVNTLKTTREACLAALAGEGMAVQPAQHAAAGIVFEGRRSPFQTQAFARGDIEMQDEASQLVAELVAASSAVRFAIDA